jgi:CubicO group peptidase (beta-lactamase class C family)
VKRRAFIQTGLAVGLGTPVLAALKRPGLDEAVEALEGATREGQVTSAVLHVVQRDTSFTRSFGKAHSEHAMFLLGSISKPVNVTALMTLFDRAEFKLNDPLQKFIPQFKGDRGGTL